MDFSKFKLDVYDVLGLILPGYILVCEIWVTIIGWASFSSSTRQLGGVFFSVLLLLSFGVGHLVQELGDASLKRFKGPRFFMMARDRLWATKEGEWVRSAIWSESQIGMDSVDAAFDFCLTRLEGRFPKRDSFLATSDLARSLVVLSFCGAVPATRIVLDARGSVMPSAWLGLLLLGALLVVGCLAWKRMVRFRELSDVTVFRAYLGTIASKIEPSPVATQDSTMDE